MGLMVSSCSEVVFAVGLNYTSESGAGNCSRWVPNIDSYKVLLGKSIVIEVLELIEVPNIDQSKKKSP